MRNKIMILLLTILVVFSSTVHAQEVIQQNYLPIINQKISIEDEKTITSKIKSFLIENYSDYYNLDNFSIDFDNYRETGTKLLIDLDFFCDMTLAKSADQLPYFMGMNNELEKNKDLILEEEKEKKINEINSQYYQKPDRTQFKFTIELLKNKDLVTTTALISIESKISTIYYNVDDRLVPMESLSIDKNRLKSEGENAAREIVKNSLLNGEKRKIRSVIYNNLAARDYALAHCGDTPQYSSDCANFVSYCVNSGGIPQTSDWRPGANNWIRTGFNNNGGIIPYMLQKGYFYHESNRSKINAGSIIYWNGYSHVGLTTYGDTVTIKYAAHTSPVCGAVLPESENVKFYKASASIIN